MVATILMIGELVDYACAPKRHFSLTKGFHLAEALAEFADVDYLTTGTANHTGGTDQAGTVTLRSLDQLPSLHSYTAVVLMRETNLLELLTHVPGLAELLLDRSRSTMVVARGDSFAWMADRALHECMHSLTGRAFARTVGTMFDVVCAQTPELARWSLRAVPWRMRRVLRGRVHVSPMGVPAVNHRIGRPLPKGRPGRPVDLLYMGRLKSGRGTVIQFLCDVLTELGPDFVLHLYPGSFVLPEAPHVVHRPSDSASLEMLRRACSSAPNVVVHEPFDADRKVEVVTRHLVGLDVSPSRPHDRRFRAGNAKLLEYCWLGLPVVTEQNVHNSALVAECGNGVALPGVPSPAAYAQAVREVAGRASAGEFDAAAIAQRTIDLHGWPAIAADLADLVLPHLARPHLVLPHPARPHLVLPHPARPHPARPHLARPHLARRRRPAPTSTTTKQDVPLCR